MFTFKDRPVPMRESVKETSIQAFALEARIQFMASPVSRTC